MSLADCLSMSVTPALSLASPQFSHFSVLRATRVGELLFAVLQHKKEFRNLNSFEMGELYVLGDERIVGLLLMHRPSDRFNIQISIYYLRGFIS